MSGAQAADRAWGVPSPQIASKASWRWVHVRAPESIDKLHDLLGDAVEHARNDRRLLALRRLREEALVP